PETRAPITLNPPRLGAPRPPHLLTQGSGQVGSCLAPAECPKPEPPGKTGFRTNGAIAGALIKLQAHGAASTTKLSRSRMACGYELPPPTCPRQGSRARHRPERRAPAALL